MTMGTKTDSNPRANEASSSSPPPQGQSPRLHVAFPVVRTLPLALHAGAVSLDRGFFDRAGIANPLAAPVAHARVERAPDQGVFLVEEGGPSGTFLDGRRLSAGERVRLVDGAVLRIGTTLFVYREGERLRLPPTRDAVAKITKRGIRHTFIGPYALPVLVDAIDRVGAQPGSPLLFLASSSRLAIEAIGEWLHERACSGQPFVRADTRDLGDAAAVALLVGRAPEETTSPDSLSLDERVGLFGLAEGGTLLLDEIVDLPPAAQRILLHWLDTGTYRSPGSAAARTPDVRVLVASGVAFDAASLVGRGVVPALAERLLARMVKIPVLSERREDIGALVLSALAQRKAGGEVEIEAAAIEALLLHDWPGDVPELLDALEKALGPSNKLIRSALPGVVLASRS